MGKQTRHPEKSTLPFRPRWLTAHGQKILRVPFRRLPTQRWTAVYVLPTRLNNSNCWCGQCLDCYILFAIAYLRYSAASVSKGWRSAHIEECVTKSQS